MNCKKCNAFVPDDSAFCPECGEKVEVVWTAPAEPAAQVFCPQCGAGMAAADEFCPNCGYKAEAAPAAKKPAIPAKFLKIGIAAVAVVLVVAIVIAIFAGGSKPSTMLFDQDGSLMSVDLPGGKPIEVMDKEEDVKGFIHMSEDGSRIFYVEDDALVYRPVGKKNSEATKISKEVTDFKITADGKKVFYIKNNDLYVSNLKDSTKVAKDVVNFYVAPNGKTVVYAAKDDDETVLYRKTGSNLEKAEAKKIASDVSSLTWWDEDLDTVYFSDKDSTLYSQTGKKDKVKISSDAQIVGTVYDDGALYYLKVEKGEEETETTLYFFDGKKSTKITKDITSVEEAAPDKPALLFTFTEGKGDDKETTYCVATKGTLATMSGDDVERVTISFDGTKLLILKDYKDGEGTLYEAKVSGKKIGEPKKIAEEVSDVFDYLANGKYYYYTDVKDGEGTLYIEKKKIQEDVATNIRVFNEEDDRLYFFTDVKDSEGSLYFTTGSKATKIADDVSTSLFLSLDGQMTYKTDVNKDGEGTLYVVKGSKGKKIAEDVGGRYNIQYITKAY